MVDEVRKDGDRQRQETRKKSHVTDARRVFFFFFYKLLGATHLGQTLRIFLSENGTVEDARLCRVYVSSNSSLFVAIAIDLQARQR